MKQHTILLLPDKLYQAQYFPFFLRKYYFILDNAQTLWNFIHKNQSLFLQFYNDYFDWSLCELEIQLSIFNLQDQINILGCRGLYGNNPNSIARAGDPIQRGKKPYARKIGHQ